MIAEIIISTISGIKPNCCIKFPPTVKYDIKIPEKKIPIGLDSPNSATGIPLNPSGASTSTILINFPDPERYTNPPPIPAKAPAITIANTMFFFSLIPAYLAASALKPHAFIS